MMIWRCECSAGECDFDTKAEAYDARGGKFCGRGSQIKRVKDDAPSKLCDCKVGDHSIRTVTIIDDNWYECPRCDGRIAREAK